ncbi:MAG: peroxiredoxin family protein [Bacteroidales bacterium]
MNVLLNKTTNMYKFSCFIVVLFFLFSCNNEKGVVHIEGEHPSVKNKKVYLIKTKDAQGYQNFYKAADSAFADKNGRYILDTEIKKSEFYQLRNNQGHLLWVNDLFLQAGDSISLSETKLTANSPEATKINRFPDKLSKKFPRKSHEWITKPPDEFIKTISEHFSEMMSYTKNYFSKFDTPDKVVDRYEKENELKKLNNKLNYLQHHNMYAYGEWHPMPLDSMKFELPVKEILKDTSWYYLEDYQRLIRKYTTAQYHSHFFNPLDANADKRALNTRMAIIDTMFTGIQKDIALATLTNDFWRYFPAMQEKFFEDIEDIMEHFKETKTSEQFYSYYKKAYQDYKRLEPGTSAPGFTLKDTSGQEVSLKQFQGNYVYITFWNTMNNVFTSNLDAYRRLLKDFEYYDNLSMVFIALQPSEKPALKAWEYFLRKYPFGENHLIAPGQMSNEEIQPYQVEAIPTHVLIDPEGKIITARAPGPDKIMETIEKIMANEIEISTSG